MSFFEPEVVVECDVLAVGGSGAAITAAVYASERGADVAIASKGKFGYSGNAIMAGGGFGIDGWSAKNILGIEAADESFDQDRMFDCIVKESFFIADQNLVEQYVYESPEVVKRFLGWAERGKQVFNFYLPGNWQSAGISWGRTMKQGLDEAENVRRFEDVTVVEVLTENNSVVGAIGIDIYTGDVILFKTPCVILGTGGYQPFSMKNTVSDMTGDGVGIAFRAGAQLADMEFLLAFPTAVVPHEAKGSIYPFIFEYFMRGLKYDVVDKDGVRLDIPEEIIKISRGGKLSKLVSSYYWGYAMEEGRAGPNGGMFYDYSMNTPQEKENAFEVFNRTFSRWHRKDYYKGDNLADVKRKIFEDEPLEVGLGFEYSMGGILIDEKMRTCVNGLLAAGETASGVFGACRVGDGLTEMLCQGARAGITAGEYVKEVVRKEPSKSCVDEAMEKIKKILQRKCEVSSIEVQHKIEQAADSGFGVIRCGQGLAKSLEELKGIREMIKSGLGVRTGSRAYNWEWITALQMENLALCVETGIASAILRKESRGCHIRKDYQFVDNESYLKRFIVSADKTGGYGISGRDPIVTKLELPKRNVSSVIDYFLDPCIGYKMR